jgi:hypothetical protein
MSHLAHLHTVPFIWPRDEQRWYRSLLADVGNGSPEVAHPLLQPHLVFQPIRVRVILVSSSFFNHIPHQKEHEIMVGVFITT